MRHSLKLRLWNFNIIHDLGYFHNKRTKVEDHPQSSDINPHCHVMNMGFHTGTCLMRAMTLLIIESDLGQDS